MKSLPLQAYPRTLKGRTRVKKLRLEKGRVPAVVYGRQTQPQGLEVNTRDLENLIHHSVSENLLVDLSVADDPRPIRLVLLQEIQHHPLTGKVLHLDLREVSETERVTITVPVETVGEAIGVKTGGGVLEHVLFKVKVRALPRNLPEFLQIDVSSLEVGHSIHLGEIPAPEGVEILGDRNIPVVAVALPRAEVQETAEVAAEVAPEVEVIREKKEEGEAGAEAAGEKKEKAEKGEKEKAEKGEKKPKK